MLVLSRKRGEAIVIDDQVTVTVLEVRGDRVKLGFTGPAEVPIHRQEVHQRIGSRGPVLKYAGCA
jgi:carbon storage regulator